MEELFINLFLGMSWVNIVLFALGIVLLVIEVFVPGLGVFGITGTISTLVAMLMRVVNRDLEFGLICGYLGLMLMFLLLVLLIAYLFLWAFKENGKKDTSGRAKKCLLMRKIL